MKSTSTTPAREKKNRTLIQSFSKPIVNPQLISKKEDKLLCRTIRFTTTLLFFLNQLMSYSIAIEIDQGNIRRIEMSQKSSKLIEKVVNFIFGEDDVNS
ncbi:hypothetical protein CYANOKiyG1_62830 [Okeania sp. KiyG1]|nr:hypothetical protein CYANOKiyG1_62830 [Okeania sp. KiyG1]